MRVAAACCLLLSLLIQPPALPEAPAGSDAVRFNGLKEHYSLNQRVSFQITSTQTDDIRLSCAVEQAMNTDWREVSMSVFSGDPPKSTRVIVLRPGKEISIEWDPWNKAPEAPFPAGRYRFRADVRHANITQAVYSKPFTLEPGPR
jgi:hypothetical protein